VVLVVYRPGPEFLVLLRSPDNHGYWHLVAGGIEEAEEPVDAALRELGEETGLVQPVGFEPLPLELGYARRDGVWVTLHAYSVEAFPDWEPVLNDEHVEYVWLAEDEAVQRLAYPEPREAVRAVARQLEADV
jgi:8-oxo-dGTP pyrophosphatase MutT (NUDIX family)